MSIEWRVLRRILFDWSDSALPNKEGFFEFVLNYPTPPEDVPEDECYFNRVWQEFWFIERKKHVGKLFRQGDREAAKYYRIMEDGTIYNLTERRFSDGLDYCVEIPYGWVEVEGSEVLGALKKARKALISDANYAQTKADLLLEHVAKLDEVIGMCQ